MKSLRLKYEQTFEMHTGAHAHRVKVYLPRNRYTYTLTELRIQLNRTHAIASITSLLGGFPSSSLACEQAAQFKLQRALPCSIDSTYQCVWENNFIKKFTNSLLKLSMVLKKDGIQYLDPGEKKKKRSKKHATSV